MFALRLRLSDGTGKLWESPKTLRTSASGYVSLENACYLCKMRVRKSQRFPRSTLQRLGSEFLGPREENVKVLALEWSDSFDGLRTISD